MNKPSIHGPVGHILPNQNQVLNCWAAESFNSRPDSAPALHPIIYYRFHYASLPVEYLLFLSLFCVSCDLLSLHFCIFNDTIPSSCFFTVFYSVNVVPISIFHSGPQCRFCFFIYLFSFLLWHVCTCVAGRIWYVWCIRVWLCTCVVYACAHAETRSTPGVPSIAGLLVTLRRSLFTASGVLTDSKVQ